MPTRTFWFSNIYHTTTTPRHSLFRGINNYNSSYSSHNKLSPVITTNHPKHHSAEPSTQVWWGNRNYNWQEDNSRDSTDLTNNYYDNYICACMCLLYNIYNLHSIPVLHNFHNRSSALMKYIDTVWAVWLQSRTCMKLNRWS